MSAKCNRKTEVYSRVCGYHRPITNWNLGKQEEFRDRRSFRGVAAASTAPVASGMNVLSPCTETPPAG